MEIAVDHPLFRTQRLSVTTMGLIKAPQLLYNGAPVKPQKGVYTVAADDGQEVPVQLKGVPLDPVPRVKVGDTFITLIRPLTWLEYVWIGLPLFLVAGGAIGIAIGLATIHASSLILRSTRSNAVKYALTGLLSVLAYTMYFVTAMALKVAVTLFRH